MTDTAAAGNAAESTRGHTFLEREEVFCDNVLGVAGEAAFDVVMSHDVFALRPASMLSAATGAALWYDVTDVPLLDGRLGAGFRDLPPDVIDSFAAGVGPLIRSAQRTFTVGPSLGHYTSSTFGLSRNPVVLRNARTFEPPARDHRIREDVEVGDDTRLVLYLNLAAPGYGVEDLLQAMAVLPSDVHVAVLGRVGLNDADEYARELLDLALSLGILDRLHFLDPVAPDDVPAYASGADLAVITLPLDVLNAQMALPNRFFDAVMARLPLASVRIADIESLLEAYSFGATFSPGDPAALADVIKDLLDPQRLPTLRRNAARAATELCWEREEQRLLETVDEVWDGERPMRVCVLARKNVATNLRLRRQCQTLLDGGHDVTLMAIKPPEAESPCAVEGVRYLRVAQGARLTSAAALRLREQLG